MKAEVQILDRAETAVLLRVRVGPLRSWPDFLTDCIRGKQDLAGERLLPCCRRRDRRGFRPYYSLADIEDFIRHVRASSPFACREPIRAETVTIDRSLGWRLNRLDREGNLIPGRPSLHMGASLNG